MAKEGLVVAGLPVAARVFELVDEELEVVPLVDEGAVVEIGRSVLNLQGRIRPMLLAERTALNLLQRLCGIATLSGRYAAAVEGTGARVVDTRKTTPGLRLLEKHAVKVGGCHNHRFGLSDAVLIKDNHLAAAGSLTRAVRAARQGAPHLTRVEVEVQTLEQLEEALSAGADVVMLDNMDDGEVGRAVAMTGGRALLEASGGVTLERVGRLAELGVDIISVGALTHSAPAADLSMRVVN